MGTRAGLAYPEGDAGGLTSSAQRLSGLAAGVAGAAASAERSAAVSGWEGPRYADFVSASRTLAASLSQGAAALRRASSPLAELATQLGDAQRRIRAWAEEIEAAEKRFQTAQSAVQAAQFAERLTGGNVLPLPGPTRLERAEAAFDRAAQELDELRARYIPKARQLCDDLTQQDQSTANALKAATKVAPTAASDLPGTLSILDLKTEALAGIGNRDGTVGANASASIEAILIQLQTRFSDGLSTVNVVGTVGANAGATAAAEAGARGLHLGAGVEAQAGAKGSLSTTLGHEDTFALKPSVEGRAGPGVGAQIGLDVDQDGVHAGIGAAASPLLGAGAHVEVHANPAGILRAIRDAPRTIDKVKDILD